MAEAVEKRINGVRQHSSRVRQIGFVASSAATAALFVTYWSGNRYLGFGRSISGTEQRVLLIVAGLLMVAFGAVNLLARRRAHRLNLASTTLNRSGTGSEGERK